MHRFLDESSPGEAKIIDKLLCASRPQTPLEPRLPYYLQALVPGSSIPKSTQHQVTHSPLARQAPFSELSAPPGYVLQ